MYQLANKKWNKRIDKEQRDENKNALRNKRTKGKKEPIKIIGKPNEIQCQERKRIEKRNTKH